MTSRLLACVACCGAILNAAQTHLYVEPFVTKSGAAKLREDMIAELRKLNSVSLVNGEAGADLILGGAGEIWVKGYRSLNPRSSRLPSGGTPVYSGYLSVELRDSKGETVWSYLATPAAESGDVEKDLAKRIAKNLAEALARGVTAAPAPPATMASGTGATKLRGAGATFPYPVYEKWFTNYRRVNPNLEISYEAVGSEAGVHRLLAGDADFGASDSPRAVRDLAPSEDSRYLFFPAVAGAVVPIVNLPGVSGQLSFTPEALAGIFLGRIVKWNDPILRAANPSLRLPDLDIVVVHRADGSGTTFAFTDFLSKTVPEWQQRVGAGLAPKWPAGHGAAGNDGVAKLVKELGGSIGYVEFIYALRHQLTFGKVRNRNGENVEASLESIELAARAAVRMDDDLKLSIVNAPGAGSYPISSFTWIVVPAHIAGDAKRNALTGFLTWMLGPGQAQAAALGYVALPKDVLEKELAVIKRLSQQLPTPSKRLPEGL